MPPQIDSSTFNPNEFTESEIVKLIYRDLVKLRSDFDEFVKSDTKNHQIHELIKRVTTLEIKVQIESEIKERRDKSMRKFIAVAGIILTLLSAGSAILVKIL